MAESPTSPTSIIESGRENLVPRVWQARLDGVAGVRDSLAHSGYRTKVLVLNLPRQNEIVGPYRSVYEARSDPNVCFDVVEQGKGVPRWQPGFAELMGLVETGVDVAAELAFDPYVVVVFASRRAGEAARTAVAIASAVVTALAKSKQEAKTLLGGARTPKTNEKLIDDLVNEIKKMRNASPAIIKAHAERYYDQILFRQF